MRERQKRLTCLGDEEFLLHKHTDQAEKDDKTSQKCIGDMLRRCVKYDGRGHRSSVPSMCVSDMSVLAVSVSMCDEGVWMWMWKGVGPTTMSRADF